MATETRYEHVVLDANGTPIIGATSTKVKELIAERFAWGWSPEELLVNHPDLTLGQIFSASDPQEVSSLHATLSSTSRWENLGGR